MSGAATETATETEVATGAATGGGRVTEGELRRLLGERGIVLRPEEVAPVLATARFLARAADLVRAAPVTAPMTAPGRDP